MDAKPQRICILVLVIAVAACGPAVSPTPATGAAPELSDCALTAEGFPAQVQANCGSLAVPEDWTDASSRSINLKIAVAPAVSRSPQADALFVLAGGPGQAVTESYPLLAGALEPIGRGRDIVLVDQRGTGGSNPLRCSTPESLEAALALPVQEQVALLQTCPDRLDADPTLYTTVSAVQDLDAVRAALGYERVSLYGVSYGTRVALAYMRRYPEHVRAAVLDAVVNPGFYLLLDAPRDGQRALEFTLERCQADAACREAFPNLLTDLEDILETLDQAPAPVSMADPVSGEPLQFTLTRQMFATFVFNVLYAPEAVALLPLALHSADQGDFAPLLGLALASDAGLYDGLFYSVACAEDAPFFTDKQAQGASQGTYFGDMSASFREVCTAWPRGPVEDIHDPVASQAPTLLLSGEADPITPPPHAAELAATLPNSLHLVAPGMGHGVLNRGCLTRLVADFVEQADFDGLDVACVERILPPPFFVRPTGPNP
jgi:pimeloyl-ACP methyl ester carboxylesterase